MYNSSVESRTVDVIKKYLEMKANNKLHRNNWRNYNRWRHEYNFLTTAAL